VLIDVAVGLRLACCFGFALGFSTAMLQAIGRGLAFIELSLDSLARFAKIDDITHYFAARSIQGSVCGGPLAELSASARNAPIA
jgi:hypothetical protein